MSRSLTANATVTIDDAAPSSIAQPDRLVAAHDEHMSLAAGRTARARSRPARRRRSTAIVGRSASSSVVDARGVARTLEDAARLGRTTLLATGDSRAAPTPAARVGRGVGRLRWAVATALAEASWFGLGGRRTAMADRAIAPGATVRGASTTDHRGRRRSRGHLTGPSSMRRPDASRSARSSPSSCAPVGATRTGPADGRRRVAGRGRSSTRGRDALGGGAAVPRRRSPRGSASRIGASVEVLRRAARSRRARPRRRACRRRTGRSPGRSCGRGRPAATSASWIGDGRSRSGRPRPSQMPGRGGQRDVDAGQVHQLERAHREALGAERRVDLARPSPSPASSIRSASIVNGRLTRLTMKPGRSAQRPASCPRPSRSRRRGSTTARVGERRRDDLDEGHDRRRIEEVEADDAIRSRRSPRRSSATDSALVFVARIDVARRRPRRASGRSSA